jgi:hypothetical protein
LKIKKRSKQIWKNQKLLDELKELNDKIKNEELLNKLDQFKQNSKNQVKFGAVGGTDQVLCRKKAEQLGDKLDKLADKLN